MKKKMLFLFNMRSGKGMIRNRLGEILDIFVKSGFEVTAHPTQCYKDAEQITTKEAGRYDIIVCSGGDGTLDEVVTGMMRCEEKDRRPIGYIPAGSTNDFGNTLKINKKMEDAAWDVVQGTPFACDIGAFNNDFFVYIAAFGAFTDVSYETKQEVKNVLGHLAYMIEGMKRLPTLKSYQMTIRYEDREISGKFLYGMITNSDSVGGFKHIAGKDVKLNDGVFEVVLIKEPRKPMDIQSIITSILMRDLEHNERIITFKTNTLTVESENEIQWTLDGEFGGKHKKVEIINKKEAVQILVNEGKNLEKLEKRNEMDDRNEITKEIEGEIVTIADLLNAKLESEYAEKENSDGISEN
ncbi:MAG: YegS/Rv2252/BmrU family lipid kinase [Eubacteriales bacterium]|nr:YegS/Rv2252/BmrU family lipid kinase [Eubacteriales bacterium]